MRARRFIFTCCLNTFGPLLSISGAQAQTPFSVPAKQSSLIQSDGPKQGSNGDRYFNVEGKDNKGYADFGVLRFDTSSLKGGLDKKFGAGHYKITGITLQLTQSNARFTKNGGVNFYFSTDDATDIKTRSSPLKYPYNPGGQALRGEVLASGKFVQGKGNLKDKDDRDDKNAKVVPGSGEVNDYDLFKGHAGEALASRIQAGKTVTLVLSEADPGVAATWAGPAATGKFKPPTLTVKASKR